ncbi:MULTISPECIES: aminotransferase class I/II-fold pyridoxal phosphate-dependent enzyme [Sphingomonadales]|jgi:cobalamin biosynthesis protein CobC|uniref:Aminotransferase n=2 Tax=Sphingomonadaceae TaxID=41297 RepID=A0A2V3UQX7_9SPHN|nr:MULTISPECIES: aminotransferase class I/II-fold pyridoxal phosphate-dependent enzyme [Sphingomonadales]MBA4040476.1 pyridoxal phosphate-dependent class II aminotransferase [Sphingobium sp.]MDK2758717.1 aminotransferase class I/II-fold pyridoxal phosphate-dependent enzyme [Blastomonas fulva]PXW69795.1 L-threonine O-3-phosphate decarboxylase [Blastomonas natatoria]
MTDQLHAKIAPFAVHGGRIDLARALFGGPDWLDLSTGISPWAFPVDIPREALTRLPSPDDLALLETRAAECFGSDPAATMAVPGSDLGLRLIGQMLNAQRPAAVVPGYSGHTAMWPNPCQTLASNPDELIAAAASCDAMVLARPGNPGGEIIAEHILQSIAKRLAACRGWLIVDEAFADADPDLSLAARGWPNLIILRSFGKFAGLAGLRLGFVIAPPAIAAHLRRLLGDWPISGPAVATGIAFYRNTSWQSLQRRRLAEGGERLDRVLSAAGLAITASTPFFRTCVAANGWALFDHLAQHAILTRPFADDPARLRIGLPEDAITTRHLARALADWSNS